jgi:putative ABC transport system permease protein
VAGPLNPFRRRRDRLERDLDRELQYHIDRRVDELIEEGFSESEARRRANIELGGVPQVQEAVRDAWTWRWLDAFVRDVRYAIRSLTGSWGFALGAASVLALAIGANVAMFSVVDTVLLQPLGYPGADRLVSIETLWTNTGRPSQSVSGPDFLDWQAQNDVFETMAVYYSGDTGGTDDSPVVLGDRATFANPRYVSADFFAVFGQTASAGRLLTADDYSAGRATTPAAVVRHEWAVTNFGSAAAAIGKSLTVNGDSREIVGVAAPGFRYPDATDLWLPSAPDSNPRSRSTHDWHAVGKLEPGAELARAQSQMRIIGDALARQHPENQLKTVMLIPLHERLTGHLRATLWVLMGAVGVVWLIGCANIANLLLARGASRTREIALRAALGAGRGRVLRQLLTENSVLGGAAGLAGLLLASVLVQGVAAMAPADLPRIDGVRMDPTAVLFALGLALASTLIFGLVPALHASRLELSDGLKQGGAKTTGSKASSGLRSTMVVAEVSLSVILLTAAGLLLRSFLALQHVDLGFTTDRVLVAVTEYTVKDDGSDIPIRIRFFADVLDRLRAVPGVSAASAVAFVGMGREPRPPRDYFIEGRPEGRPGEQPQAEMHAVTPDYFKTLEIPILAGRDFARTDTPDRPRVAIINQTMARLAFPGESPIGKRLRVNRRSPWMEIVGVVGDTRWQDPTQPPPPVFYGATTQGLGNSPALLVRTSLDRTSLANMLRAMLHEANPAVPVKFETMEELFAGTLAYPRFRTQVIGLFAGAAALLAAVGIFSVLACLVGQRARELAVRRALGAGAGDVIRLVAGHGLRLVAIGLAIGLAGALAVTRLLTGLLYGISAWDPGTYLGTIAVLGGAALSATVLPAIRAATIAPVILLQQD